MDPKTNLKKINSLREIYYNKLNPSEIEVPSILKLEESSRRIRKQLNTMNPNSSTLNKVNSDRSKGKTKLTVHPSPSISPPSKETVFSRKKNFSRYFPISVNQALSQFEEYFSEYEKRELFSYDQIYYIGNKAWKEKDPTGPNIGCDDEENRLILIKGDHIAYRYAVISTLGMGTFGTVCKAFDHKTKETVAIKVIRNTYEFSQQASIEIQTLEIFAEVSKSAGVIQMKEHFVFRGHKCIVFELLGLSLYDALEKQRFRGFEISEIREFSKQILRGMHCIRRKKVIHCDIKPENILFCSEAMKDVKIIDFGSAFLNSSKLQWYVQSRFYRAPEVILGLKYSSAIDIWSFGCLIYELRTGEPLFMGENEKEQIQIMVQTLGLPPPEILRKTKHKMNIFKYDHLGENDATTLPGSRPISELLKGENKYFVDFVSKCLTWMPEKRIKPRKSLSHPFFNQI